MSIRATEKSKRLHRYQFVGDDLKELLVDALRFDGESIPDGDQCSLFVITSDNDYDDDFELVLQFDHADLITHEEELAEAEKERLEAATEEGWIAEPEEEETEESEEPAA
jgi:hypothetical protein